MTRGERFYELLLRLYPAEFRARYGRAMRDFQRDRLALAAQHRESIAALWVRTVGDAVVSATAEHLRSFVSGGGALDTLRQDLAFALRGLRQRPRFAALVIGTVALGVGANAAIFSVVSGVLLRPLPYPRDEQLFSFGHEAPQWLTSEPDFIDYKREMKSISGLAAYDQRTATLSATLDAGSRPERVGVARASEGFFDVIGAKPVLGRTFVADDHDSKIARVAVLSYGLWERDFAASRSVIGRTINLDGAPRVVIGVMAPRFEYPKATTAVWIPRARFNLDSLADRNQHYLFMVGRLRSGFTLDQARAEALGVARAIMRAEPAKFDPKAPLTPHLTGVREELVGQTRPYLLALLGAVGFILLIACANVANLLLVRGAAREKELAVRTALGASRRRLVVQLSTEGALLSVIGALMGLALAIVVDRVFVTVAPKGVPRLDDVGTDWRVLSFTAATCIITAVLIGVVPSLRASRGDLAGGLRQGGRTTGIEGASRALRRTLVALEMALAVTSLSGAGMLLRSLWALQHQQLGFDPRGVLTAEIALLPRAYDDARASIFYEQLMTRVRTIPGVRVAGAAGWLPVVGTGGLWGFRPEGGSYPDGRWPLAVPQQATPDYFAAAGIPVLAGRDFTGGDRDGSRPVVIVSEKLARAGWPGQNAIGKRLRLGADSVYLTVVGIVGDIQSRGFGDPPEPTMYFAYGQSEKSAYYRPRDMSLVIRTDSDPFALVPALRREVAALDRTVPVSGIRSLEQIVGVSVAVRKFSTVLLAGFAVLALLLAGLGIYGVIAYAVTLRRYEIGVRMALGAANRSVLLLIMSEGVVISAMGLAVGLVASGLVGRAIQTLLFGVAPTDPASLVGTSVLLAIVAIAATMIPARRALRVDPLEALRTGG
jgi:putative ABC transport system permease protein